MRLIDAKDVRRFLPMADCIDAMETAMVAVSESNLAIPLRTVMPLVDNSAYFAVMPGSLAEPRVYGAKIISLHPANTAAGRPAIQGFVALFDHDEGHPIAMVDGAEITAIRTAAASALATRRLARPDASTLGIMGCGVQARTHLEAILAVRAIEEIRVWSRSQDKVRAFVEEHADRANVRIVATEDPRAAAACDIVCTTTSSQEPVLFGEWVRPGAHVNLVGAYTPTSREADTSLIAASRLYVDSLASASAEAGDILIPIAEGAIGIDHVVGEIGALLLGRIAGRSSDEQMTVYKSLGIVAQDLVAAHVAWLKAAATE